MRAGQRLGAPAWASSSSHLMARQPIAFVVILWLRSRVDAQMDRRQPTRHEMARSRADAQMDRRQPTRHEVAQLSGRCAS